MTFGKIVKLLAGPRVTTRRGVAARFLTHPHGIGGVSLGR